MANILTPTILWKNFSAEGELMPVTLGERTVDGTKFEYVNFSGRDTGAGRVTVYAVLAVDEKNPSHECIMFFGDDTMTADEGLLSFFVKQAYSVLFVDYAGKRDDGERYTVYPKNVDYANAANNKNKREIVEDSADKTCWYEWVAVGIYAKRFLKEKFSTDDIGLIGKGEGGEIVWKLAYAEKFSCAVVIDACGWTVYKNNSKYKGQESVLDDEQNRFVAGLDSQVYAPLVRCPMLILCSTNDPNFDYDRAYDTFARLNPEIIGESSISYSVNSGLLLNVRATKNMLLFLDSNVRGNHVFIPKPAEITITLDDESNLIACVNCDPKGIVEKCGVYLSEDCYDFSKRDWTAVPLKRVVNSYQSEYYLNIYDKNRILFAVGYAVYANGFTTWSKLAIRKVGGHFRNERGKTKLIYSSKVGADCFSFADGSAYSVGNMFLTDEETMPRILTFNGFSGIYSKCGLRTSRINSPQFSPSKDSILKMDIYAEEDGIIEVGLNNHSDGNNYTAKISVVGEVWQSQNLPAKIFKNENGISLDDFTDCDKLVINGNVKFVLNNLLWL